MKRICMTVVLCLACVATAHAGIFDMIASVIPKHVHMKPMGVRVLLMHDQPGATIGVSGKYKIFDPNTKELISTRFVGKKQYMEAKADGLAWREEFPGVYQLLIVSDDPYGVLTVNDVEYRGELYVYDVGGAISIINELPVEDYIKGVLAGCYHDKMNPETLSALAITARTEAFYQIQNPSNRFWAIDGRKVGYKGYEPVNPSSPITKAVDETEGMVLSLGGAEVRVFDAKWDASVGATPDTLTAKITLPQADELAGKGEDAITILNKAFPGTKLKLTR